MMPILPAVFEKYTQEIKEKFKLLEGFTILEWEFCKIDWDLLRQIEKLKGKNKFNELPVYNELQKRRSEPGVYCYSVAEADAAQMFDRIRDAKARHAKTTRTGGVGTKGFLNLPFVPDNYINSTCLYVGSRKMDMHTRLKEHLGYGNGRTGAMHLAQLYVEGERIPEINFHYIFLSKELKKLTTDVEAVVQRQLRPFIGKGILGD
jgi:hypothetical protein